MRCHHPNLKTPNMRKRTINIFFSWLVVAMVYYGLSFNTKNIGGDIYVSNFISGFAEVVACVVIIPALSRYGRVKIYSGTFILGGVACIAVALVLWTTKKGSLIWLVISLAMTGKFLIAGTFALAYLYTAELFPTPVRNVAGNIPGHDRKVPDCRDFCSRLPLHCRAFSYTCKKCGCWWGINICQDRLHVCPVHCGHFGQGKPWHPRSHLWDQLCSCWSSRHPLARNSQQKAAGNSG